MGKTILIVDDDADFNQLLTDIYSQAGYVVHASESPEEALEIFRQGGFDLVVTDQKMPGLTGEEYIRAIKEITPDIPVIMVSGYLDNDTIRSLIREGVGGVFLKPLNVFSLLKRTATLIEEREAGLRRDSGGASNGGELEEIYHHKLPFRFEQFPAKDRHAREFAQKWYDLREFKTNLVAVTPRGTDVAALTQDLAGFSGKAAGVFHLLERGTAHEEELIRVLEEAGRTDASRVTFVVPSAESLAREQYSLLMRLARKKPPYEAITPVVRFVFCVGQDLDTLFEERVIDDAVYMFMGTTEIRVPALVDIPDDIPELARRYLEREAVAHGLATPPRLELTAVTYLREQPWPGNSAELHRFMRMAIHCEKPSLGMEDMERIEQKLSAAAGGARNLQQGLRLFRHDYVRAFARLSGGDAESVAESLCVSPEVARRILE